MTSGKFVKIQIVDVTNNVETVSVQLQYAVDHTDLHDEIYQSIENIVRRISTKIASETFIN